MNSTMAATRLTDIPPLNEEWEDAMEWDDEFGNAVTINNTKNQLIFMCNCWPCLSISIINGKLIYWYENASGRKLPFKHLKNIMLQFVDAKFGWEWGRRALMSVSIKIMRNDANLWSVDALSEAAPRPSIRGDCFLIHGFLALGKVFAHIFCRDQRPTYELIS